MQKKGKEERTKQVERQKDILVAIPTAFSVFILVGTVGKVDYMSEIKADYPVSLIIVQLIVGIILLIPFFVRYFYGKK